MRLSPLKVHKLLSKLCDQNETLKLTVGMNKN